MLVQSDGSTAGTVGGGILEARVMALANEVLKSKRSSVKNFQFTGKDAATMDAICGGQVDVLVEWVDAASLAWKEVLTSMADAVARHQKSWLLTALPGNTVLENNNQSPGVLLHTLVWGDGRMVGSLPPELPFETVLAARQLEQVETTGQRWMVEPLETGGTVYIFGAGHVGRCLAPFTRAVGFKTVVLDDRPEYVCAQNFPTADEIIVLDSFQHVFSNLAIETDSFIVIVTRGHLNDRAVLTQALKTQAGYIGMIGSQRKCKLLFDEMREIGFVDADFHRVHAPIGLAIKAETPEEIGISIAAEMIQVRARLFGG
jgi:xanthine dehydrogenase accessory factor